MSTLPAAVLPRVTALVRLFASPSDGEALGAVRALGRTLAANGASFHDLADRIERPVSAERPGSTGRPTWDQPPPKVDPAWGNSSRLIVKAVLQRAIDEQHVIGWEREFALSIIGQIAASYSWRPSAKQEARLDALLAKLHAAGVRA